MSTDLLEDGQEPVAPEEEARIWANPYPVVNDPKADPRHLVVLATKFAPFAFTALGAAISLPWLAVDMRATCRESIRRILLNPALTPHAVGRIVTQQLIDDGITREHHGEVMPLSDDLGAALAENPSLPLWSMADPLWLSRLPMPALATLVRTPSFVKRQTALVVSCLPSGNARVNPSTESNLFFLYGQARADLSLQARDLQPPSPETA